MMRNRKTCRRLAGAAGALLLMGIVFLSLTSPLKAQAVDLTKEATITVSFPTFTNNEAGEDTPKVAVDAYKIASAEPVTGYDTYAFVLQSGFESLQSKLDELTDQENKADAEKNSKAFAKAAAELIRDDEEGTIAAIPFKDGLKSGDLGCGLYLVLAHGEDMKKSEYFSEVEEGENKGDLITLAETDKYTYSFSPVMVSLPFRGDDASKITMTSDNDKPWNHEAVIALKAERKVRFTELTIKKVLPEYELRQNTTFVFKINIFDAAGKEVETSIVRSMVLENEKRTDTITISKVPVGRKVVISEEYTGANYSFVSAGGGGEGASEDKGSKSITIPAVVFENEGVVFENKYNKTDKGGGSIDNDFQLIVEQDEDGNRTGATWELKASPSKPE